MRMSCGDLSYVYLKKKKFPHILRCWYVAKQMSFYKTIKYYLILSYLRDQYIL